MRHKPALYVKSTLRYSVKKLRAKKMWCWETGISSWRNEKIEGKLDLQSLRSLSTLHWLTMQHCVWTRPGIMWWCGRVPCTKNYSPPSSNEEYYTTAPQCKMLHSRMIRWFAYFTESHMCRRSVFLLSTEYRINVEAECYHSYNCYIQIMRTVSLLSTYRYFHCLPDHILFAVLALQGSRD